MSRNVWLSFSEWELISEELSNEKWHSFKIYKQDLKKWKDRIKHYHKNGYTYEEPQFKFERVAVHHIVKGIQNPCIINTLCREYWRSQDMQDVMSCSYAMIGFILTHVENVNMNTTLEQWINIQNQMKTHIQQSDKRRWFYDDLIKLYKEVVA
jgi:hypothetical protein